MNWEDLPYRFLVEGSDDKHVVINLLKRHGVYSDLPDIKIPCIYDCGGIDELIDAIPVAIKSYKRLGIMVDANADLEKRWNKINLCINKIKKVIPDEPNQHGTIAEGIFPESRIGIWVMPNNNSKGALEEFLKYLIPKNDPCWDYSQEATKKAKDIGAKYELKDSSKAILHTWLAWQKDPGLPFGTAITALYFNTNTPEALSFVTWFKALFL